MDEKFGGFEGWGSERGDLGEFWRVKNEGNGAKWDKNKVWEEWVKNSF